MDGEEFKDEHLNCSWKMPAGGVCGTSFIFSGKDQKFYKEQGFVKPKYCRPHRDERKRQQKERG